MADFAWLQGPDGDRTPMAVNLDSIWKVEFYKDRADVFLVGDREPSSKVPAGPGYDLLKAAVDRRSKP
jgi:hypothetical protein